MKITIIAGARPNFMKIAPLMRAINAAKAAGKNISARLVYTGSALFVHRPRHAPSRCIFKSG